MIAEPLSIPSPAHGHASGPGEAEFPELWSGLVGLWAPSLGRTGTRLYDRSGTRSHGTLTGGATWDTTLRGPSIRVTTPDGQYVSIPGTPANRPTAAITLECWAYWDGSTGTRMVLVNRSGNAESGGATFFLHDLGSGMRWMFWATVNGTSWGLQLQAVPTIGRWTHLCGTYKSGDGRLYVDGVLAASSTATTGSLVYQANRNWRYGADDSLANQFVGWLGAMSIHSRALSAVEVRRRYLDPTYSPLTLRRRSFFSPTAPPPSGGRLLSRLMREGLYTGRAAS